jgi:uncharacterized membrane protein required for colicin V production
VEIFKFLGAVVAIYCSLHYYTTLSDFIKLRLGAKDVPLEFLDFVSAVFLASLGFLIFLGIRIGFDRFIKMETTPNISKVGGLVLGIGRSFLLTSLITFLLVISSVGYLSKSALNSFLGRRLLNIAPNTYTWMWDSMSSKFMTNEKFNEMIPKVLKDLKR